MLKGRTSICCGVGSGRRLTSTGGAAAAAAAAAVRPAGAAASLAMLPQRRSSASSPATTATAPAAAAAVASPSGRCAGIGSSSVSGASGGRGTSSVIAAALASFDQRCFLSLQDQQQQQQQQPQQCGWLPQRQRQRQGVAAAQQQQQQQQQQRRRRVIAAGGPAGGMGGGGSGRGDPVDTPIKKLLLFVAVAYVLLVVAIPFANVFVQAFHKGVGPFLEHVLDPDFVHATKLTLLLAAVTVPVNVAFGTLAAILITRNEFPGKVFLLSLLDMPFSISPVVTGLMLTLLYGRTGWFSEALRAAGFSIVFAFPGMAIATMFVTLPYVVRELMPTLEAMDPSQEEAAATLGANPLQIFWRVTLPNIRWGLLYGTILTNARAMGEFGAVSVISGNIIGRTQTLTLFVESAYKEYNSEAAFAAAVLLSVLALCTLWVKDRVERAAAAEAAK